MKMSFTAMCLGRGQGKGWIENFKPKPVPITIEQIGKLLILTLFVVIHVIRILKFKDIVDV